MSGSLFLRLGAHDRALMNRCAIAPTAPWGSRAGWTAITHLGGTGVSLLAAGLPLFACCALHYASRLALATVVLSHILVQIVKRTVVRTRPAKVVRCVISRVRPGVHYPSDVLVGQLIALATAGLLTVAT